MRVKSIGERNLWVLKVLKNQNIVQIFFEMKLLQKRCKSCMIFFKFKYSHGEISRHVRFKILSVRVLVQVQLWII